MTFFTDPAEGTGRSTASRRVSPSPRLVRARLVLVPPRVVLSVRPASSPATASLFRTPRTPLGAEDLRACATGLLERFIEGTALQV